MSDIINSSIKTAAKETALVLLGTVASFMLGFVVKLLIVKNTTTEELGIYSLAIAVVSTISFIACLGLQESVPRYISIFLGEGKASDAEMISKSAIHIGILSGITACLLLFLLAGFFAQHVFYKPGIAQFLKSISFFIPFFVMSQIYSGVLRGYRITMPKILFLDIGMPLCFFVLLSVFMFLNPSFPSIIYAYTLSIIIIFPFILRYGIKKIGYTSFFINGRQHGKELLHFSIPILLSSLMVMLFNWTDTLMLGRYSNSTDVGVYNISITLASSLTFPVGAFGFVFIPLAGGMHAKGQDVELKRTYQILTKWIFSATFPIFFVLFFFPEMTITFLFGSRFIDSAVPLRILALGFLMQAFLGVSGHLMVVKGMSRELMKVSFLGSVLNAFLNYVLIKHMHYGIIGASLATMVSYTVITVVCAIVVYKKTTIHSITAGHLKPVVGSATIGLLIYLVAKSFPLYFWMIPFYLILFVGGYILTLFLTKSIENEDIDFLEAISKETGIEMRMIRKFIKQARV